MKRLLSFAIPGLLLCIGLASCYNDNLEDLYPAAGGGCATDTVTFSGTIQPIIAQNCAFSGCHAAGSAASGINLSTYAGVQAIAANGKLVGTTTHAGGFSPMPKNAARMDDCKLSQIQKWVSAGAPNN